VTLLKYIGPKKLPYILQTPIPFLSRSDHTGTVAFNPTAEVDGAAATFLLAECAGAFERVGSAVATPDQAPRLVKPKADPLQYVGKRFGGKAGKWNAIAFIKKHKAEDVLGIRKLQIVSRVIYWELVPLALADVTSEALKNTWNPTGNKLGTKAEQAERSESDSITVPTAGVEPSSIP
jgi:hypothetical protein